MTLEESEDELNKLILDLETFNVDSLKHTSYKKFINKLLNASKRSLLSEGTRLNIIIQQVKTYNGPCFQRDVILDLIARIITDSLSTILNKPFSTSSKSHWSDLACSIATLPDLYANYNAVEKYPTLEKISFYTKLVEEVYRTVEFLAYKTRIVSIEHKLFLLKILGRVALADSKLIVWKNYTRKAIDERNAKIKRLGLDILTLAIKPPADLTSLELFIEHLFLPIFTNLEPRCNTGELIFDALGLNVYDNNHFKYLLCDKSLFKTNYHLPKEKQAVILFNIAAYISNLATTKDKQDDIGYDESTDSLLIETLLEIVKSWTNPTKILVRTYKQNKYISYALLIFFKHAIQHDNERLTYHVNKIQMLIVNSVPTYLNRASPEQRNLACCLCKLILPKLRDIILNKHEPSADTEELKFDFKVEDLEGDLLYMEQLFNQDVGLLFQDVSDRPTEAKKTSPAESSSHASAAGGSGRDVCESQVNSDRLTDRQLQKKINDLSVAKTTTCRSSSDGNASTELANQRSASPASGVQTNDLCDGGDDEDEDDLAPYIISEDEADDLDDDDEYEMVNDAACAPIYLRDCIDGLIENNNHRYVRLCLIKAGSLIDEIIRQHDDADAQKSDSVCLAAPTERPTVLAPTATKSGDVPTSARDGSVCSTIKDVGVELARTLLFLDNQFNLDNFDQLRMSCLVSLCFAAPDLVGRYLIDEFNGTNRSMRQQLDIMNVLVSASHRLAFGCLPADDKELDFSQTIVISGRGSKKSINKFAPYASLFFYGVSYRLKADFVNVKFLISPEPESVLSSFRRHQINDPKHEIETVIKSPEIMLNAKQATRKFVLDDDFETDRTKSKKSEDSLKLDSISDDSYLLSRILLSISNILSCSAQQPVTCKLSSDLLDILSAYRCHPDSGVQRAILRCLKMIRDCTPSTYYRGYIEKRMLRSFGPWLTKNEANIQR